ncbi:3-oxoacyl-ACP synthase III family protein [Shewanella intestini]|uniref:3-oxoacyl-ACP synthase n=1 Tax=Shewanella intestini TaxID=2017544 RepID=A0ABS5I680_9GAMM|nr:MULTISPECIES: 3-oxoacyl-[acyl-carrier-protein] synthase III C-terminal domain-containing protein [Shewanella]MBR9729426.1 3-oxoacyl-ACP synthase [Shewanella intestini]MRG37506.1 3-oxoacyl-ACP synthase [Shewanella sp. XMDDZSB0408]
MAVKFAAHDLSLYAVAHQLPHAQVTNEVLLAALSERCGRLAARKAKSITKRLGIEGRHLTRDLTQATSTTSPSSIELSQQVLTRALAQAGLSANDLDYLITHTCTPHTQVPPNAAWLADVLAYHGPYLELRQACTGFANGLQIASAFCHASQQAVAIVGVETGSVYFDMDKAFIDTEQLVNYVQMGDGAAATIVGPKHANKAIISDIYLGQVGHQKTPGFYLDSGSKDVGDKHMARFHHNTQAVREQGSQLFELGWQALQSRGYQLDDFAYILPHQANGHIDVLMAQALGISPQRIVNDAKQCGNLGSAAIWVSLAKLIHSGKLRHGEKVAILGAEATKYLYGGFVYQHHEGINI